MKIRRKIDTKNSFRRFSQVTCYTTSVGTALNEKKTLIFSKFFFLIFSLENGLPKQPVVTIVIGRLSFVRDILAAAEKQGKLDRDKFDWFYPGNGKITKKIANHQIFSFLRVDL